MSTPLRLAVLRWLTVGYWLVLFTATHWPRLQLTEMPWMPFGVDKWMHLSAFGLLTMLCLNTRWLDRRWLWLIILIAYALCDELTQNLIPGRGFEWYDLACDCTGILLAYLTISLINPTRRSTDQTTNDQSTDGESFIGHARWVSILTMISRAFGLIRDAVLAWIFGMTGVMDSFVIAFMIPNLFRRLFGEGSLAGAFIPIYTQLNQVEPASADQLARRVMTMLIQWLGGLYLMSLTILLMALHLGWLEGTWALTAKLTCITLAYMPLVCLVALIGGVLQSHARFGPPAAAPILLNLWMIAAAVGVGWWLPDMTMSQRAAIVATAVVLAGISQLIWQLLVWRKIGALRQTPDPAKVDHAYRQLLRNWLPTTIGLAVLQLNALADMMIVFCFSGPADSQLSLLGFHVPYPMTTGSVAVLNGAQRLFQFPLGVFGIAVSTAIFPAIAAAVGHRQRMTKLLRQGLRLTVYIGLPASVGLLLVREPLTGAIFYKGGRLTADDATRIAWVLAAYAPAVWAYSMNQVLNRICYAHHEPHRPLYVSLWLLGANLILNLTLIWHLGPAGVGLATAVCAIGQCLIMLQVIRRYQAHPIDRHVRVSWIKTALATVVMAGAVYGVLEALQLSPVIHWGRWGMIVQLIAATTAGGIVLLGASILLRCEELRWLIQRK